MEDLKKVATSYSGRSAAGNAVVLAAEQVSAERPAEAIEMLKGFLSSNADHPLRELAAFRMAEYSAAAGDAAGAEKEYELIFRPTPDSAFALLRLGDMKWGAGDAAKAKEYYDMILTNGAMAGSPARNAAQSRVDKAIKAKAPEMVEYKEELPPPPVPTPGAPTHPMLPPASMETLVRCCPLPPCQNSPPSLNPTRRRHLRRKHPSLPPNPQEARLQQLLRRRHRFRPVKTKPFLLRRMRPQNPQRSSRFRNKFPS